MLPCYFFPFSMHALVVVGIANPATFTTWVDDAMVKLLYIIVMLRAYLRGKRASPGMNG